MKNVYIYGASNAFIRNGWQIAFSDEFEVHNSSMGASCSGLGLYFRNQNRLNKGDLVLIESSVSDQDHLMRKAIDKKHLDMYISSAYSGYSDSGVQVLSLIMPTMFGIEGDNQEAIDLHRKYARLNGVPFINSYSLLNYIKMKNEYFYHACFRDFGHLHPTIAKFIGEATKEIANYDFKSQKVHDDFWNESFSILSAEDLVTDRELMIELKGSSLLKLPTAEFKGSNKIFLKKNGYLMGFVVDVSNSNCNIVIDTGSQRIVKNINTENYTDGKSQFRYICFQKPVRVHEEMSISCVSNEVKVTESTLGEKEHDSNLPISAYLCGFLISDSLNFEKPYLNNGQDFEVYDKFQENVVEPVLKKFAERICNALSVARDVFKPLSSDFQRLAQNDADVLRELAKKYIAIGDRENAVKCIERASELRPEGPLINKLKLEIVGK